MRLAFSINKQIEVLVACTDLIRKSGLAWRAQSEDNEDIADYLAASSQIAFRVVNDVGAATKLIDCGYFAQAGTLCRAIAEAGLLALFFSEYPGELRRWRTIPTSKRYKVFSRSQLGSGLID